MRDKKIKIIIAVVAGLLIFTVGMVLFAKSRNSEDLGDVKKLDYLDDSEVIVIEDDSSEERDEFEEFGDYEEFQGFEGEGQTYTPTDSVEEQLEIGEALKSVEGLTPEHGTGYIFVGDSRFVNMNDVCKISDKDNLFMVAKVGEGYSWFTKTALPQIKRIISSGLFSKWKLIICLGINDLEDLGQYTKKYQELKSDYDITLVSVNPITSYGNLSNQKIEKFNSGLKELQLPYIDTYDILMRTGFNTTDGLHYNADTTKKIYNGILLGLKDIDKDALTTDTGNFLDKASHNKKVSLQKEILAQNKYVKKVVNTPAAPAASANTGKGTDSSTVQQLIEEELQKENTDTGEKLTEEKLPDFPVDENGEIDEDYINALYGKPKRNSEENPEEGEEGSEERQEQQPEQSEEEEEEED